MSGPVSRQPWLLTCGPVHCASFACPLCVCLSLPITQYRLILYVERSGDAMYFLSFSYFITLVFATRKLYLSRKAHGGRWEVRARTRHGHGMWHQMLRTISSAKVFTRYKLFLLLLLLVCCWWVLVHCPNQPETIVGASVLFASIIRFLSFLTISVLSFKNIALMNESDDTIQVRMFDGVECRGARDPLLMLVFPVRG